MFKRNDNESVEDYQIRICELKDSKGYTWCEIADIINTELGWKFTESKYRKAYKAFMQGYNRRDKELIENDDVMKKYESKLLEIKKERQKLSAMRLENTRTERQNNRFELLYENIAQVIKALPLPQGYQKINSINNKKEYILTIADIHAGAKFDSINNTYNFAECERRFNQLYLQTVGYVTDNCVDKINIISLGDEIQGILRISDLKMNESSVIDALVFIQRQIAQFLNELSVYCKVEYFHICKSNHTQIRPLGTKASELAYEDMSKIIIQYLTDILYNNENINIYTDLEKDFIQFNIFNFNCIALHGHTVNNINTFLKDISNNHRVLYDYVFVAHSHSSQEIINSCQEKYNVETLIAPSFIGSCPYADKLMVSSQPACKIFEFDETYGHIGSKTFILK